MKRIALFLVVSMFLLTACSEDDKPIQTTIATDTEEITEVPTIVETETTEQPFEIKLTDDSMKDPYGIAINSFGHIYVSDAGNDRVLIFDEKGTLLGKWDNHGSGEGEFKTLGFGGLAIDKDDNVFVVDNENYRIQKFDKDGNFMTMWGTYGTDNSQFVRAIGIAIDNDNNVYVTDDGNPYVQKFDNDGNFLMRFGGDRNGSESSDGKFSHATGIAVDDHGNIFVADYETKYVQKFDESGVFITSWKMGEDIGVTGTPEGIAVDKDGKVYITDYDLGRLQVFDNDGNFLWALGGKSIGLNPFNRPTAIAFDGAGKLYVVNQLSAKVSIIELP